MIPELRESSFLTSSDFVWPQGRARATKNPFFAQPCAPFNWKALSLMRRGRAYVLYLYLSKSISLGCRWRRRTRHPRYFDGVCLLEVRSATKYTEPEKSLCTWFCEFCSCCCLPLLPQLAWRILPTTYQPLFPALYFPCGLSPSLLILWIIVLASLPVFFPSSQPNSPTSQRQHQEKWYRKLDLHNLTFSLQGWLKRSPSSSSPPHVCSPSFRPSFLGVIIFNFDLTTG